MALCSLLKSSNELTLGQQQHRFALQRGASVRTRVAQPSTSSATPSAATFEVREALLKGNYFKQPQAETLLNVFPTMKDVASKDDITGLERAVNSRFDQMNSRFDQMNSRFDQIQLLAVLLALAVVVVLGLVAGALMLLPVNPSSAFGMVVSAFIKKNI